MPSGASVCSAWHQCPAAISALWAAISSKPGANAKTPDVLGSYPAGPETWGWRTTLTLKVRDRLILRHYNITPKGEESLGVEFDYRRV